MKRYLKSSLFVVVALFALNASAPSARSEIPVDACSKLGGGVRIGDATVLSAQMETTGTFRAPDGHKFEPLPSFCRLVAQAAPSAQSNIVIELWLPDASTWNGKLLATGNGGFAGAIVYSALAGGLKRGYAVANTDMGTYPANLPAVSYQAGNERPEIVKDWGYRATHEMVLLSKVVVDRYYAKAPADTYYAGCSTGGHQGLTEAQRYPDDFDAILAGAPGNNRTHLHAMFTALGMASHAPGAGMSPESVTLWSKAMMNACVGKDGGAPSDVFLTDPTQCTFRPRELLCKPGDASDNCLQEGQVKLLETVYGGTRNPRTGGLIYPPEVRGIEAMLQFMDRTKGRVSSDLSRWVFGPAWDPATFDFDHDMAKEDQALGKEVNALDPDLSRFVAHGGKLILYHGWADGVVSPIDTVIYYDRLKAMKPDRHEANKQDYARLFMAPGMSHCGGGSGPNIFGQVADLPQGDSSDDLLVALDQWVVNGTAPETVLAKHYANEGAPPALDAPISESRLLCAYPKIARYNHSGDPAKAENFACSQVNRARYEMPAAEYLH